jgi:hypothetical protein
VLGEVTGISELGEGDKVRAVRKIATDLRANVEREARFPDARRAGDGDDRNLRALKQPSEVGSLPATADQRRSRNWKTEFAGDSRRGGHAYSNRYQRCLAK